MLTYPLVLDAAQRVGDLQAQLSEPGAALPTAALIRWRDGVIVRWYVMHTSALTARVVRADGHLTLIEAFALSTVPEARRCDLAELQRQAPDDSRACVVFAGTRLLGVTVTQDEERSDRLAASAPPPPIAPPRPPFTAPPVGPTIPPPAAPSPAPEPPRPVTPPTVPAPGPKPPPEAPEFDDGMFGIWQPQRHGPKAMLGDDSGDVIFAEIATPRGGDDSGVAQSRVDGSDEEEWDTLAAIARVDLPSRAMPAEHVRLVIGLAPPPSPEVEGIMRFVSKRSVATLDIDVMVEAPDFTAADGWKHRLTVTKADPFSATIGLELAPANPADVTVRTSTIRVHYSYLGQPAGVVVRTLCLGDVSDADLATMAPPVNPPLQIAPSATPVDLTIRISRRDQSESASDLVWTVVDCAHPIPLPDAPIVYRIGSSESASAFATRVTSQVNAADGKVLLDNILCGIGTKIRQAMPQGVLDALDAVAKAVGPNRLARVLLLTDECHVPWELAYFLAPPDAARAPYLGAQFAVSRWIHGEHDIPVPPPATLRVSNLAIVLGSYENAATLTLLPHAKEELALITEQATSFPAQFPHVTSVDASADALVDLLNGVLPAAEGTLEPEMVHFACHGEVLQTGVARRSVLYLNDGSPLPEIIFAASALAREHKSFLFMNACQVGVGGEELGRYSGFPGSAIAAGFSGFIGPLWSVNDEIAKGIAVDFYRRAFGTDGSPPRPVADVLADMRSEYANEKDIKKRQATWLAYVHYGHPHFTVTHA